MLLPVAAPEPIVSLDLAKRHLRLEPDDTSEDEYLEFLIATATGELDGPHGTLGRALGRQTWDLVFGGWAAGEPAPITAPWWAWHGAAAGWRIALPMPPLISVDAVTYRPDGAEPLVLATSDFTAHGIGAPEGGFLSFPDGSSPWSLSWTGGRMTVRFTAGYPAAGEPPKSTVPAPLVAAILLMVSDLYENREAKQNANLVANPTVARIVAPYRRMAL